MITAIYILWSIFASLYFLIAIYSWLEQLSGRRKTDNSKDLVRQGLFVTSCVVISILLDRHVLRHRLEPILPEEIPYPFVVFLIFPLVMAITATLIGPSEKILIRKAPRPTERKR